jgi:aspartate beta-hydroxylase
MTRMTFVDEMPARLKKQVAWWLLRRRARTVGFGQDSLRRVEEYLDVSLQLQEPRYSHRLQRPRTYFPGLTAQSWHDPSHFAWTAQLEKACATIKRELFSISTPGYLQPHHQGLTDTGRWSVYYLYQLGRKVEENCRRCPQTAQVISAISDLTSTGLVYFSVLTEGTHITPHCGPTNTRLRCHLGLVVPQGCQIRVGSETRSWEEGKCLIFDDSFEHEVWNSDQQARVVLVVDVWHPDLTTAEVWALGQIMKMSTEARKFFKAVRKNRNHPPSDDNPPML